VDWGGETRRSKAGPANRNSQNMVVTQQPPELTSVSEAVVGDVNIPLFVISFSGVVRQPKLLVIQSVQPAVLIR
jgi:hypothetical protein